MLENNSSYSFHTITEKNISTNPDFVLVKYSSDFSKAGSVIAASVQPTKPCVISHFFHND